MAYFYKHAFKLKAPVPATAWTCSNCFLGTPPHPPELTDTGRLRMKVSIFTPVCLFMGDQTPPPPHSPGRPPLYTLNPPADPPVMTSSGGHCSSPYASYWNAFLFINWYLLYGGFFYRGHCDKTVTLGVVPDEIGTKKKLLGCVLSVSVPGFCLENNYRYFHKIQPKIISMFTKYNQHLMNKNKSFVILFYKQDLCVCNITGLEMSQNVCMYYVNCAIFCKVSVH